VDGVPVDESTKSEDYETAKRYLTKMNGRKARGELGGRNAKLTVGRVLDHFLTVLPTRVGPDTLEIQKLVVEAHIRPYFGTTKADKLTTETLLAYRESRGKEKTNKGTFTSPSTINRELSLLRNALRTAAFSTPPLLSISCIPRFPITNEDEFARQGFISDEQFEALISELPSYLIPITTVSFNTGIRMGELLKVQWEQVDFEAKLIRLYRGETKGKKPRTVPMLDNMERVLVAAKAERDEYWPECDFVFHRMGQPLTDFRGAWASARKRAGVDELLFHDLRRSGVRVLSRSGVPERVIMSITGHRTREMFDRYNITSEEDLADAAARVKAFRESKNGVESDLNSDKNRDSGP
jgi:integrase